MRGGVTRKIGTALALVALALQVLLAFAHVHVGPSGKLSAWAGVVAANAANMRNVGRDFGHADTWTEREGARPAPVPVGPHDDTHPCQACLVAVHAKLVPPTPTASLTAIDRIAIEVRSPERRSIVQHRTAAAFDARGPPAC